MDAKEYQMKAKEYRISTFEQLLNLINSDNYERLMQDFIGWVGMYNLAIKKMRKEYPEETKNLLNWEILNSEFIWIDDGKHDIKDIVIENVKTGEIHKVKLKNQKI